MRRKRREGSISWYLYEIDKLFNPLITSLGYCQRCKSRNNILQCSHVLPKGRYKSLRYNPVNVTCLCAGCHKWFWHESPLEATEWFKTTFPERWIYLTEAKKKITKMNVERYAEIFKMVIIGDLKGLMKIAP